jgi:4'-phosphopantetheinyl transferase
MQVEIVHSSLENIDFSLALWAPTDTDEELLERWEALSTEEQMPVLKAAHRRREWLGTRLLLHHQGIGQLQFLANGKPVIPRGGLSISHCKGSVAVVTSEVAIGLDIQEPTEQILAIRSKFCSSQEWSWLESHEEVVRALTIVWSVKESIYKYWGEQVDFAGHIAVQPFRCEDAQLEARYCGVHGERTFSLWHTTRGTLEVVIAI